MSSGLVVVGSRRTVLESWLDSERRSLDVLQAKARSAEPGSRERERLTEELARRKRQHTAQKQAMAHPVWEERRCPRCDSPKPNLHPAVQYEGEVQPCSHSFHQEESHG